MVPCLHVPLFRMHSCVLSTQTTMHIPCVLLNIQDKNLYIWNNILAKESTSTTELESPLATDSHATMKTGIGWTLTPKNIMNIQYTRQSSRITSVGVTPFGVSQHFEQSNLTLLMVHVLIISPLDSLEACT